MKKVYECRPSCEEDRPQIDFEYGETAKHDWLRIGEVLDGLKQAVDYPSDVTVSVPDPTATDWDCFMVPGTRGAFSVRFVNAAGWSSFQGLTLLPVCLNGETYFFLRCEQALDCFDRTHSTFETFRTDPDVIKRITHYAFRDDSLPDDACFVLPEMSDLFVTELVVQRIQNANLKGIRLQPLP